MLKGHPLITQESNNAVNAHCVTQQQQLYQEGLALRKAFGNAMKSNNRQQQYFVIGKILGYAKIREILAPDVIIDTLTKELSTKANKRLREIQQS